MTDDHAWSSLTKMRIYYFRESRRQRQFTSIEVGYSPTEHSTRFTSDFHKQLLIAATSQAFNISPRWYASRGHRIALLALRRPVLSHVNFNCFAVLQCNKIYRPTSSYRARDRLLKLFHRLHHRLSCHLERTPVDGD
jgi:hypothetical protein